MEKRNSYFVTLRGALILCLMFLIFAVSSFAVSEDDLLLRYHFDASGATTEDSSGNVLHGSVSGATFSSSGKVNGAYSFDGVDDEVIVPGTWVPQQQGTIMFWIKPIRSGTKQRVLGSDDAYEIFISPTNILSNQMYRKEIVLNPSWSLGINNWYHVAMTWDKNSGTTGIIKTYINGGFNFSATDLDGLPPSEGGVLRIGHTTGTASTEHFGGLLDELKIYNRVLTDQEISDDYSPPLPPPLDSDVDGLSDGSDNCPAVANADQTDTDLDGQGDACDADDDNDGVSDITDNCPLASNFVQTNTDGDAEGDACDNDDDNDGVVDVNDCAGGSKVCTTTEICSSSICAADTDGDGIEDSQDNCPTISNSAQTDADSDGVGNACDCGDSVVVAGEQCDAGVNNGVSCIAAYQSSCTYCTTSCQQQTVQGAYCGDLVVNGAEECDGGTTCTSECKKDTDNDGLIDTDDNCPS
ncbi:thrombospondin type 3 repeat-containing protein, partial [Candidatus Woesearchaeota archaeon]|nr:thrombospondin type 3 repeat-containing protein [Candidatus Woesearchaeota archaeon]